MSKEQSTIVFKTNDLIFKIEKELMSGNFAHEKGLEKITEILRLMDKNENDHSKPKNKDKLMELIYEVLKKINI